MTLPAHTHIGSVHLTVRDLEQQRLFYERALGLEVLQSDGSTLRLRPPGGAGILAPPFAVLVPSRADLAQALRRVVETGWRFTGASDHLVSEALYLNDPEGNGIEIYRDRPRAEWGRDGGGIRERTPPLGVGGRP